jgi:hypothetical protein
VGLGMRREVTLQVLATAAVALHKAHQQYTQGQPPESHGTTGQELRARGAALLKYLGDWAATSAPRLHGAHRSHQVPASQHPHVSQPPAAPGSSWVSALSDSDQAALAQLQSAVWCPVVTQCPEPGGWVLPAIMLVVKANSFYVLLHGWCPACNGCIEMPSCCPATMIDRRS